MAVLVHIADQRNERSIRRGGLKSGRYGVYAVPVSPDFMTTHQLQPLLTNPDPDILLDLLAALSSFSDPNARELTRRLADSAHPMVRASARQHLNAGEDASNE